MRPVATRCGAPIVSVFWMIGERPGGHTVRMDPISTLTGKTRTIVDALGEDRWRDHSLALWRDGYWFGERRRTAVDDDLVPLRLLGQPAILIRGEDAARFFYTERAMRRGSAVPPPIARALCGAGAVHGLDAGRPHRKALFVSLLDADAVRQIGDAVAGRWDTAVAGWHGEVDLFAQLARILFRTGSEWVGADVARREEERLVADMVAMVDGFGSVGPRHLKAHMARRHANAWMTTQITAARQGPQPHAPSVLERVARHRDTSGRMLADSVAVVEALNLIRPLVAVAWLASMAAVALDRWPVWRGALAEGRVEPLEFAQEVRRYYPFVPVLAARPAETVTWRDHRIAAGTRVVLDVWGTNHDPRRWRKPLRFDPLRFRAEPVTRYNLVPQGGGFRETGHRCPGEDVTLMVLQRLVSRMAAARLVVTSDHRISLRRMPPVPDFRVRATAPFMSADRAPL